MFRLHTVWASPCLCLVCAHEKLLFSCEARTAHTYSPFALLFFRWFETHAERERRGWREHTIHSRAHDGFSVCVCVCASVARDRARAARTRPEWNSLLFAFDSRCASVGVFTAPCRGGQGRVECVREAYRVCREERGGPGRKRNINGRMTTDVNYYFPRQQRPSCAAACLPAWSNTFLC